MSDSLGICEIPLKVPKPGTNFAGAVEGNPNAPAGAVAAAVELQKRRERLQTIEQLAANTAEDAYKEFIDYEHQLELLQQRLDENGRELGQRFRWRDAWRQHTKAEHNDLEFERACTLFNAASAQCFLAARARERGPRHGGLKEALAHFQHAAAFLEKVYEIVKPNIWGLRPKWVGGPASLSPDLSLDVLSALKDLMLAQAQRTVYDKAVSEGLSNGVTAKLAAGAASMFADALKLLQKPEVANHINEEGGLFSKGDKSWLARVECSQQLMLALAEEHVAKDLQAKDGTATIGEQITRMQRAIAAATAATAAGGALHGGEKNATAAEEKRMRAAFHAADNENSTVYHDKVPAPAELPEVEKKLIAKCLPAAPSEAPLKFEGLLPSSLARRIEQHHAAAHERLHALSSAASEAAALAAQALRRHQLPEVLDACKADKRLPERLVAKIEQAKQKGDLAALTQKLARCEGLEQDAEAAGSMADAVLNDVDDKDAALLGELASMVELSLEQLASGRSLGACRKRLQTARGSLRTAVSVTAGLKTRLEAASADILSLDPPLEQLHSSLPHLDGTPLEEEPCVPALRKLLEDLDAVKADGAAALAAAHAYEQQQHQGSALGEQLLQRQLAGTLDEAMAELQAPLAAVERDAAAREARRAELLRGVAEQAAIFETARVEASSFAARQAYLSQLGRGAEECLELSSGLDEGANFYTSVVQELRKTVEEASRIADAREGERQAAKRNAQAGGSQRHAAAGPYAATPGGRAQVHAATAFMAPAPAASPYPQQYGGAQQSPYPAPQPVQQQPYNPYNPQQLAQAQPYRPVQPVQPVQPQASSATPKIMCCKCHKIFQVPPGAKIVGCPFCGTHNRVP